MALREDPARVPQMLEDVERPDHVVGLIGQRERVRVQILDGGIKAENLRGITDASRGPVDSSYGPAGSTGMSQEASGATPNVQQATSLGQPLQPAEEIPVCVHDGASFVPVDVVLEVVALVVGSDAFCERLSEHEFARLALPDNVGGRAYEASGLLTATGFAYRMLTC